MRITLDGTDAKQAGYGALNSTLNLNNAETQAKAPAQAQKNTASMQETESTAVNDDPAKHTPEENQIIKDYKAAVDPAVVQGIEQARSIQDNNYRNKYTITLSERVGDKVVSLVNDLIGLDVSGYKNQIKGQRHCSHRQAPRGKRYG